MNNGSGNSDISAEIYMPLGPSDNEHNLTRLCGCLYQAECDFFPVAIHFDNPGVSGYRGTL